MVIENRLKVLTNEIRVPAQLQYADKTKHSYASKEKVISRQVSDTEDADQIAATTEDAQ